jgi:hypothetical protein
MIHSPESECSVAAGKAGEEVEDPGGKRRAGHWQSALLKEPPDLHAAGDDNVRGGNISLFEAGA